MNFVIYETRRILRDQLRGTVKGDAENMVCSVSRTPDTKSAEIQCWWVLSNLQDSYLSFVADSAHQTGKDNSRLIADYQDQIQEDFLQNELTQYRISRCSDRRIEQMGMKAVFRLRRMLHVVNLYNACSNSA